MEKSKLNLVGPSFEELSLDEMMSSQGSGDVQVQTIIISRTITETRIPDPTGPAQA